MSFNNHLNSRIKGINLKLFNYSFNHSNPDNLEDTFIGRKQLIERLYSLIAKSTSSSGAYLIAGYRGMGKTSFVKNTLKHFDVLTKSSWLIKKIKVQTILFLVLCLLSYLLGSILSVDSSLFENYNIILSSLALLGSAIIAYSINRINNNFSSEKHNNEYLLRLVGINADQKHNDKIVERLLSILFWSLLPIGLSCIYGNSPKVFIARSFFFIATTFFQCWIYSIKNRLYDKRSWKIGWIFPYLIILFNSLLFFHFSITLLIIGLTLITVLLVPKKYKELAQQNLHRLLEKISSYIKNSKKIIVYINLGHDEPKEIEVFKLILRKTYSAYKENYLKFRFFRSIILISCSILLSYGMYKTSSFNSIHCYMKESLAIAKVLPSQHSKILNQYQEHSLYTNLLNQKELSFTKYLKKTSCITQQALDCKYKHFFAIDFIVQRTFKRAMQFVSEYTSIPFHTMQLDYLGLLIFFLIFVVLYTFPFPKLLKIKTSRTILLHLQWIKELLNAQIQISNSTGASANLKPFSFSRNSKKGKTFYKLDDKEIENLIIGVLQDIRSMPQFLYRRELIYVFDELDKIENHSSFNSTEEEKGHFYQTMFTPEGARKRQHSVMKLLSNLKYFLNTAQAKFIFIGGREMYDAALADVSDRNYFIGSIFSDRIYVPSFLGDRSFKNTHDFINPFIESYIFRFLIPGHYIQKLVNIEKAKPNRDNETIHPSEFYSLKCYKKYLCDEVFQSNGNKPFAQINTQQKIEKIIITLYHFISYLYHITNGSPKKLVHYFEQHVEKAKDSESIQCYYQEEYIKKNELYLSFKFHEQYLFGMINYLSGPIYANTSANIKEYNDKLLVSASFLIDHIFKFHKVGFTWRNLETIPEIIDINKSPELRNYLSSVIKYISRSHIDSVTSGLFSFMFNKRIANEIAYLSKINEEASAAFNFTLDESLAIKQHYGRILKDLYNRYNYIYGGSKRDTYINSISGIHLILGDLHLYDEQYNEAIVEYLDSIQFLRTNNPKSLLNLVLLIRTMLKLGLTLEKRGSYSSALLVYGEITAKILHNRNIKLSCLLDEKGIAEDENLILKYNEKKRRIREVKLSDEGYENMEFIDAFDEINKKFNTPGIHEQSLKITTYESSRLVYQPILAKLQIIEKQNLQGLTQSDIDYAINEFNYLQKVIHCDQKFLIKSEFYNKLGDILYVKNYNFTNQNETKEGYLTYYCQSLSNIIQNISINLSIDEKYLYQHPSIAWTAIDYCDSIAHLYKYLSFSNDQYPINIFKVLANLLSDIADSLFIRVSKNAMFCSELWLALIDLMPQNCFNEIEQTIRKFQYKLSYFDITILFYHLSGIFYKRAGLDRGYSLQFAKVIYSFKYCKVLGHATTDKKLLNFLDQYFVQKAIGGNYAAYDYIHHKEIQKLKLVFNNDNSTNKISLKNLTVNTDILELVIGINQIKLNLDDSNKSVKNIYKKYLVSPYSISSTMFNRVLSLRFKLDLNYKLFGFFEFDQPKEPISQSSILIRLIDLVYSVSSPNIGDKKPGGSKEIKSTQEEVFRFIVLDSIYCCQEIIRLNKTFGKSYMFNYAFIARVHEIHLYWSQILYLYITLISGLTKPEKHNKFISDTRKSILNRFNRKYNITNKPVSTFSDIEKELFIKPNSNTTLRNELMRLSNSFYTLKNLIENLNTSKLSGLSTIKLDTLNTKLREDLALDDISLIFPTYQREMAIKNYYSAIEVHTQGDAYKSLIENMYYLNEDFNDENYHHTIAVERQFINKGEIRKRIKELKEYYGFLSIYNPENYLTTEIDHKV